MKKLVIVAMILGFMIYGCAGAKWCKDGATQSEFQRDKYECDIKTKSGNSQMMLVDLDLWFDCMKIEKGWSRCSQ